VTPYSDMKTSDLAADSCIYVGGGGRTPIRKRSQLGSRGPHIRTLIRIGFVTNLPIVPN
jgi:hypothetical protein